MVQAIANRSWVQCTPLGPSKPGPSLGWSSFLVRIDRTTALPGWRDLLSEAHGREYTAIIPPGLIDELEAQPAWTAEAEVVGPHRIVLKATASPQAPRNGGQPPGGISH
jgi:hypothetical protein